MNTRNRVSSVNSAICPFASRRSAQCAYASISSRMASRSAVSVGEMVVWIVMTPPQQLFRHLYPVIGGGEAAGQRGAGRVVEPDVGGAEVFGEVRAGAGARDEQNVRGEVEQPGQRDLRCCRTQPFG